MSILLLATGLLSPAAHACVAMVSKDGGAVATSDAQQVILELTATGSAVEYANSYTGTMEDFGWIIVVPAPFESIADGDLARFERLTELSQPRIERLAVGEDDGAGGGGCSCRDGTAKSGDLAAGGGFDTGTNAFDVVAEGYTGTYAYTVVESDDAEGLVGWLADNDWALGANEAAISEYVEEGDYAFVLVSLAPDQPLASGESGLLPPLRIETGSSELRYPARMARDAAPLVQSTRLLVLGDQQAELTGDWKAVELGYLQADGNASEVFEEAVWEATDDGSTYVRVFSGDTSDGWLTRFETRADREAHTSDVEVSLTGGRTSSETVVQDSARRSGAVSGAWGAGLVALLLPLLSILRARQS